jgi:hypothetical protein
VLEITMLTAKIHKGRIEPDQPIPAVWEGLTVLVLPLLPDNFPGDLEQRLNALHALGATEFDAGEEQMIAESLFDLDKHSRDVVARQMREVSP